ncbi:MAG: hypothetical protein ACK44E_00815 [Anaerolineales bacterium]
MGSVLELVCPFCLQSFSAEAAQTYCQSCESPILARYDLKRIAQSLKPEIVHRRQRGIWRWGEFLPVTHPNWQISLGEGDTPLLPLR